MCNSDDDQNQMEKIAQGNKCDYKQNSKTHIKQTYPVQQFYSIETENLNTIFRQL